MNEQSVKRLSNVETENGHKSEELTQLGLITIDMNWTISTATVITHVFSVNFDIKCQNRKCNCDH